jgi:hypothetical protein
MAPAGVWLLVETMLSLVCTEEDVALVLVLALVVLDGALFASMM